MRIAQILSFVLIHLAYLIVLSASDSSSGCQFSSSTPTASEMKILNRLKPLFGKRYSVTDPTNPQYTYDVGICAPAVVDEGDLSTAGAVQTTKKSDGTVQNHILGYFTKSKIITGSDWVYLEYTEGDKYNTHCNKESRRAVIMINCATTASQMMILQENNNMSQGCYYLFELSHPDICTDAVPSNLSLGSIFIIVLFSVVCVYMFFGFLYQRFVLGAKGMEQIPNYGFWQDFGNLQADGCNLVCRSGGGRGPRSYKGVGDDQLEESDERDDHLLPM